MGDTWFVHVQCTRHSPFDGAIDVLELSERRLSTPRAPPLIENWLPRSTTRFESQIQSAHTHLRFKNPLNDDLSALVCKFA